MKTLAINFADVNHPLVKELLAMGYRPTLSSYMPNGFWDLEKRSMMAMNLPDVQYAYSDSPA